MKRMAPLSPLEAGGPIRATVCLFGSFVSGPRFLRYKTSLVSGFEFRIRVSFTKLKKKQFRFPFPEQRIAPDTKLGWVTKLKSHQKPTSSFVSEFRIRVSCEAEQFVTRNWIRNSPGNETRNESIYETVSFLCSGPIRCFGGFGYETQIRNWKLCRAERCVCRAKRCDDVKKPSKPSDNALHDLILPPFAVKLSGYERCVERSAAAKHDASGNATTLSGSARILWYLRAVA